jgi:putative endonuclease
MNGAPSERRVRLGRWGEAMARLYLEGCGFRLLAERYRKRDGELDLVMTRGSLLVFVEVKTRRTNRCGAPEEALTPVKLHHLRRAAHWYLLEHPPTADCHWRLDVVSIELAGEAQGCRIRHHAGVGWAGAAAR